MSEATATSAITLTEDARNDIALAETQRAMLMTEAQTKLLEARRFVEEARPRLAGAAGG